MLGLVHVALGWLACGAPAQTPAEPAPQAPTDPPIDVGQVPEPPPVPQAPPGPLALVYTPPAESMDSGWCKGTVPANLAARLAELGTSLADVADKVPCGSADYDGDGVTDYAFPVRRAGRCTQHVDIDLVFAMGPDAARIQRVTDTEAGGCFHPVDLVQGPHPVDFVAGPHPGAFGGKPAIVYFGEGGGDWAVVWQGDKMGVTLAAMGD